MTVRSKDFDMVEALGIIFQNAMNFIPQNTFNLIPL